MDQNDHDDLFVSISGMIGAVLSASNSPCPTRFHFSLVLLFFAPKSSPMMSWARESSGAGKTTLANALADKMGLPVYHEPVADNAYLEDFYKDKRRWDAFPRPNPPSLPMPTRPTL